jgi:hypothetical protein
MLLGFDFCDFDIMIRENEYGDSISEEELIDFSNRVRKFSDNEIDELWYLCGYIYSEDLYPYREKRFKAMAQEFIDRIMKNIDSAKEVIWNLICETRIEEFKKNLLKVEREITL